jgi:hypothetical protein
MRYLLYSSWALKPEQAKPRQRAKAECKGERRSQGEPGDMPLPARTHESIPRPEKS